MEPNESTFNILKNFYEEQNVPHLLFYGKSGMGKKTLVFFLFRRFLFPNLSRNFFRGHSRGLSKRFSKRTLEEILHRTP